MSSQEIRTVAVIGAGMAGLRSAEGLRAEGFDGRIVLVGEEPHLAYDRPPLSKGFLTGEIEQHALTFADEIQLRDLCIEMMFTPASALRPRERCFLAGGDEIHYDRAVIATGASARPVPGINPEKQPSLLRTLADAVSLREQLTHVRTVTVIGGGLIGCEIAATSRRLGLDVTLVEAGDTLMERSLGPVLGALAEALHREQGVRVLTRLFAVDVQPPNGEGAGWTVELNTGEVLRSDVVVAGIGALPVVEWLAGSGIRVDDGVVCDPTLTTSDPNIMAAGDVARFSTASGHVRQEQWLSALDQARHVARNLLLPHEDRARFDVSDYFWSDQFGRKIQGMGAWFDADLVFEVRDSERHEYFARAVRDGVVVGVFANGYPRQFGLGRRDVGSVVPPAAVGT